MGEGRHRLPILSRVTKVVQPNGGATTSAYGFASFDGLTRATTRVTDPNGNVRTTYQDVRGQTVGVEQTNTLGGADKTLTTRYAYDPLGQVTKVTDAKQNVTTATYDTLGRLSDLVSPDMGRTSWRYDLAGRLRAKETANLRARGQLIRYDYEFNRLMSIDLWEQASRDFAAGAEGKVDVFMSRVPRADSIWKAIELPTFQSNGQVEGITFCLTVVQ